LRKIVETLQSQGGVYLTWGKAQDRLPRFQVLATLDHYRIVMEDIFGVGDRTEVDQVLPDARYFQTKTDNGKYYHYFFTTNTAALDLVITEH
jgi:acetoacetate decarboxylase